MVSAAKPRSTTGKSKRLSQPVRTSISIRTYRAAFPSDSTSNSGSDVAPQSSTVVQRTLSIMVYSEPILPTAQSALVAPRAGQSPAQTQTGMGVRDDTSYVFIEDRGGPSRTDVAGASSGPGVGSGVSKTQGKSSTGVDEDFEIVDPSAAGTNAQEGDAGAGTDQMGKAQVSFQTIALRPAAAVVPLLHQIASPFVLGATKSARAVASTTAEKATATKLAGTLFTLNTYTFPPMTAPYPGIVLSVHVLPGQQTGMIILEAELLDDISVRDGVGGEDVAYDILREFLEGCVPEIPLTFGVAAATSKLVDPQTGGSGYLEKMRKVSGAMARILRDAGHI